MTLPARPAGEHGSQMVERLERIARHVDRLRDGLCVLLLAAIFVLLVVQVFFRYVVNDPLSWPEELARVLFLWLAWLGVAKLFRERSHYAIDFFVRLTSRRAQRMAALLADACSFLGFLLVILTSWPVLEANSHIRTAIGLPVNLIYASLPVATVLILMALALSLLGHWMSQSTEAE